jgi:photosystem II stability/assembly factor-like uncharacterized protein
LLSASVGVAVGKEGNIRRTTDGGATWTVQSGATTSPLYGVSFANGSIGTVIGGSLAIIHTTTAGQ